MKKSIECYTSNIPIGSHIVDDIRTSQGALLIRGGTEVNDAVIQSLQRYTGKIKIEIEVNDDIVDEHDYKEEQSKIFELSDSIKQRALESVELMYSGDNLNAISDSAKFAADAIMQGLDSSKSVAISVDALKVSDEYTFKHSIDVGAMSIIIAKKIGETDKFVQDIALAGILHDLGKSKISNEIINKPSKLSDDEWNIMKQHPVYSYRMIEKIGEIPTNVKTAVLEHHENIDGTGYPLGAKDSNICKMAKILTIADVYDALVTKRAYKDAKSPSVAMEMMLGMSNKFDLNIFKAFIDCVILYPIGTTLTLSNGALCTVIKNHENYPLRPICQNIITDEKYDLLNDPKCLSLVIV